MNDKEPYQFKTFNATYTVNPNTGNLILNLTPVVDKVQEIEKKLTVMPEYSEAKSVLNKFTLQK